MSESNQSVTMGDIDLLKVFRFPRLFGSCTAALQPARLLIGLLMVTAVITAGRVWDSFTEASDSQDAFQATLDVIGTSFERMLGGVMNASGPEVLEGLADLCWRLPTELFAQHRGLAIVLGIVFLLTYIVGGGALCRMSACQFAGRVRLGLYEAVDFAIVNWIRSLLALVLPLILAVLLGGVIFLLGLLLLLPVLNVVGGIVYGLALLIGFVLTFILLGYGFGCWMIIPAVACERGDGPDAGQKAMSFVFLRPLHLAGYLIIAIIGLALGYLVVQFFATMMLALTNWLFGWFVEPTAMPGSGLLTLEEMGLDRTSGTERLSLNLMLWWQTIVHCLIIAYVVSYLCDVSTRIFLLQRRNCDGQHIEEIWWPGMAPGTAATRESSENSSAD